VTHVCGVWRAKIISMIGELVTSHESVLCEQLLWIITHSLVSQPAVKSDSQTFTRESLLPPFWEEEKVPRK
jgi:hypothetical protein